MNRSVNESEFGTYYFIYLCSTRFKVFRKSIMDRVFFVPSFYSKDCFDKGVVHLIPGFISLNILLELIVHENHCRFKTFFF